MATQQIFNGALIKVPGAYSAIKSGIKNPPLSLTYGNVLFIDNGTGANFGGGAGIKGDSASGKNSIYQFDNMEDFRKFVGGGYHWLLAKPLFKPGRSSAVQGVSNLYYARAATTTGATITIAFASGNVVIKTKLEGLVANGAKTGSLLTTGIGVQMALAPSGAASTYIFRFYRGGYKGTNTTYNEPWDFVAAADTTPQLICESGEFTNIAEFVAWATGSQLFNDNFYFNGGVLTGAITGGDFTSLSADWILAAGATETYASARVDEILDAVTDLDFTFILSDKFGDNGKDAINTKYQYHIWNQARYQKYVMLGGGADSNKFALGTANSSIDIAKYFDDNRFIVCHGDAKISTRYGFRRYSTLYKAALVLGRICGLAPQVPVTFKEIDVQGEYHELTLKERGQALDYGVVTTYYEPEVSSWVVTQGVTTLQRNKFLVNEDGTSHEITVERIAAQLNKELAVNARRELLGQLNGPNRNTLSVIDIENWVRGQLIRQTATSTQDGLILRFDDIVVTVEGDAYKVVYSFVPNFPVNKLFFTGFIVDPKVS